MYTIPCWFWKRQRRTRHPRDTNPGSFRWCSETVPTPLNRLLICILLLDVITMFMIWKIENYLKREDCNFISVDWEKLAAATNYSIPLNNIFQLDTLCYFISFYLQYYWQLKNRLWFGSQDFLQVLILLIRFIRWTTRSNVWIGPMPSL